MSNASSPNSVNHLKQLGLASSVSHKKALDSRPGSPSLAPQAADAIEISPDSKEIGGISRIDLKKMSPEELLQFTKKIFEKFDLNGDGKVSAREANKLGVPKETFDRYDEDGDGAIGLRGEFAPQFLRDLGDSGQISMTQYLSSLKEIGGVGLVMKGFLETFGRVDLDKNGEVSAEEAQKLGIDGEKFKEWDANGDGKVSLFGEYLPKVVDELRDQGVLNDREHRKLMNRIENAAKGEQDPDPEIEVQPARNRRAEERGEDRRREDPIRVREHAERWLRGHAMDRRGLEDLAGRILRR